jgi:broad specificity phosphatase PhoE
MRRVLLMVFALLAAPAAAFAQPAIFLVRHAERADAGMAAGSNADPDLSEAGRARAESLAAMLKDARVAHIFVTELKRTGQTAAPLAKRLGIEPTVVAGKDIPGLIERVKGASGNVLVVGHSNTVPAILKALGVNEAVTIGDAEHDNVFVVTRSSRPSLLRLRYR